MYFDEKDLSNKSTGEKSRMKLPKSTGIMVSASGFSSSHRKKNY